MKKYLFKYLIYKDTCQTPGICPVNSICNNTFDSYICICKNGLIYDHIQVHI
jgi:hypothetical protein